MPKTKAAFFDRDGVINDNSSIYYTYRREDFIFLPGVFKVIKKFYDKGYLIIIITNQGGISKGIYTAEDVNKLNEYIISEFRKQGIELADIFFCPHHSDIEKCLCRKPNSLMLEKAIAKHKIDKSGSLMIGDSQRDVESAESISLRAIKIDSNTSMLDNKDIVSML